MSYRYGRWFAIAIRALILVCWVCCLFLGIIESWYFLFLYSLQFGFEVFSHLFFFFEFGLTQVLDSLSILLYVLMSFRHLHFISLLKPTIGLFRFCVCKINEELLDWSGSSTLWFRWRHCQPICSLCFRHFFILISFCFDWFLNDLLIVKRNFIPFLIFVI